MTRLFNELVFSKNNGSRPISSRNNKNKSVFEKNNRNSEIRFDGNRVKYAKKSEKFKCQKLVKSLKLFKSEKSKIKK